MPRNVEIKAYIESVDAVRAQDRRDRRQGPIEIDQDDTFFYCEAGRLKLRVFRWRKENSSSIVERINMDRRSPTISVH